MTQNEIHPYYLRRKRLKKNISVSDFELTPEEMARIDALDRKREAWPVLII